MARPRPKVRSKGSIKRGSYHKARRISPKLRVGVSAGRYRGARTGRR